MLYVFIIDHKKKKAKKNREVVTFVIPLCDTMHYRKSAGRVMIRSQDDRRDNI